MSTAHFLGEDLGAAGGFKRRFLRREALTVCANSRVAVDSHDYILILQSIYAGKFFPRILNARGNLHNW